MHAAKSEEIVVRLKALILLVEPQVVFVMKYGGVIAEAVVPERRNFQFCGVFAYKNHVSLEFSGGARLDDPEKILEGGGKNRRHIKIASLPDIVEKKCEGFLRQARRLGSDLI